MFLHTCIKEVFLDMKKGGAAQPRLQQDEDARHASVNGIGAEASRREAFNRSNPNQGSPQSYHSPAPTPSGKKRGRPRKNTPVPQLDAPQLAEQKKHLDRVLEEKQCIFVLDYDALTDDEKKGRYVHVRATDFANKFAIPPLAVSGCRIEDIKRNAATVIDSGARKQSIGYAALRRLIESCVIGRTGTDHTYIKYRASAMNPVQELLLDDDDKSAKALILAQHSMTEPSDETSKVYFSLRDEGLESQERAWPTLNSSILDD